MSLVRKMMAIIVLFTSFHTHALLIKVDFSTIGSTDMWGNTTNDFDQTQATGLGDSFFTVTNAILAAVESDYYSNSYGFIGANQQLDIDFMIAEVGTDVSGIDTDHYTIQVGSRVSGPHNGFGVACYGCAVGVNQSGVTGKSPANTLFGSVFSDNIFAGLMASAGGSWDLVEAVNAIAGTLSHEIGHALGLAHPPGPQANPGESSWGVMATGASPSLMPNGERLKDRAFSDVNMQFLVDTLGLRTVEVQRPEPIPAPATMLLMLLALTLLVRRHLWISH